MPDSLAAENRRLQDELAQLLLHARSNEDIMRRHQELDLRLIGAGSFLELLDTVFCALPDSSSLDCVTLTLLDPQYDIRRILVELQVPLADFPRLLFAQDATELGDWHAAARPDLGRYSQERHGALFPEPLAVPASVAILPLLRNRELIGTLALGSFDAARFTTHMATDFVMHLASIVAICIENVINSERLKHIGLTDPLTGVNNRRYVERRLLEELGRARRQDQPLSCLYIDIDHFKKINDTIGHQAGDEVLREVALRIKAELRLSDALGRFGGEEFVVLLIDANPADAGNVAERIRLSIGEAPLMLGSGQRLPVTVSIGAATLLAAMNGNEIESLGRSLLAQADAALYRAKSGGRNRVVSADGSQ